MGQPVDTSKTFVPIPPLPNSGNTAAGNQMYVVVSDERLDAALHGKILSKCRSNLSQLLIHWV